MVDLTEKLLLDSRQATSVEIIKSVLFNGLAKIVKLVLDKNLQDVIEAEDDEEILPISQLQRIIQFCQSSNLVSSHDLLVHKNRQTYQIMLQYHDLVINQNTEKQEFAIQLDLSYLINLQNLGYEVMKYYRLE